MKEIELMVGLIAVIGIVGVLTQKIKVSLPILLVLTGMALSHVPQFSPVKLEPDTVFFIFLPPLLYLDAFNTSWKDLLKVGEVVSLLAVGLVIATVFGVAWAIHAVIPGMPWAAAFALGAIVSPTDAVAASAVAKEVPLPKKLMDIIKGESLINDATGLVAYQFAVAAMVTGMFSWSDVGTNFIYVGLGGLIVGLLLGWLLVQVRNRLNDRPVEIVFSLLSPYVTYLCAEHLKVSGVLAVVTAGLLLGWRGPTMLSAQTRLHSSANWETIAYLLNGLSFLLIGLQLKPIIETVRSYPPIDLLLWTAVAVLTPIVIRLLWAFTVSPLYNFIRRREQTHWKRLLIAGWSGMRGVVSLAAALALPLACDNGQPFPYRDLLIYFTVAVIGATLIFQGATLPYLVKLLGFKADNEEIQEKERQLRLALSREAIRTIDLLAREQSIDAEDPTLQKLLNRYLERAIINISTDSEKEIKSNTWRIIMTETNNAQRRMLIELRARNEVNEDTFLLLQNELDLEDARLNTEHGHH